MRPRARWGVLALLLVPPGAWALGLGDIELKSALNQPLDADIVLVSATPDEMDQLRASLAAQETFDRYGLDRPGYLVGLEFDVTQDNQGRDVIRVSSQTPITEPFVTMLVEATWARGRLLREYTVLLDPPVLLPAPAIAEPVQSAQTRAPEPEQPAATITRPAPQPVAPAAQSTPRPAPQAAPQPQPAPAPVPRPAAAQTPGTLGPVQRGDTLWGVASRSLPAGVTMNQLMVAIYQANPAAFAGNMNLLRAGAILTVPDVADMRAVNAGEATQEAIRQTAEWEGGAAVQEARLRLVPATDASNAGAAGGTSAAETAEMEGEITTLQSELDENRRLLALRDSQLQELQAQLSEAEAAAEAAPDLAGEIPAGAPGVDLEAEELFADEVAPEPEAVVEPEPVVAEPPPVEPAAVTSVVTTAPEGPSLISQILGWLTNSLFLIGLGVLALLGTAVWYLRHRQSSEEDVTGRWEALEAEVDAEDDDDLTRQATARMRAQVKPEDENFVVVEQPTGETLEAEQLGFDAATESILGDSEFDAPLSPTPEPAAPVATDETLSSQTVINLDQADPVAEADFHMAYGLYDQAAELVSKALEISPDRRDLKLKLLEVYFVWGNKEAFLDAAQSLRMEMGESPDHDWDKVVIMGKQICPDEPVFADATAAAADVDVDLDAGDSPELDLAFDAGSDDAGAEGVDLDLGEVGEQDVELELEATAEQPDPGAIDEDLDIGDQTAAGLEAAILGGPGDASAETTPNLQDSDATQESPTMENLQLPAETLGTASLETVEMAEMESPTIETAAQDAPTVETPTIETAAAELPTMETPTIETAVPMEGTSELPTVEQPGLSGVDVGERTAEIDLDDLGLDVKDLDGLSEDFGDIDDVGAETQEVAAGEVDAGDTSESLLADNDLLSATGVTQVLQGDYLEEPTTSTQVLGDDDATMLAPGYDSGTMTSTEVIEKPIDLIGDEVGATSLVQALPEGAGGLDLDLDDLSAALDGGATVEQPGQSFSSAVFTESAPTDVDLDVGADVVGSDEPTATEEMRPMDPQTMTEVGTKLDLARAYIDMGDPDGARGILEEVMSEGDPEQKQEAKTLIGAL